ncbi:MAG TPA: VWA domain-containing protein [Pyrinomonadaceae bacterium]|nr:VWA domain-containing protein [Pyrinomonadaceae bacterium]
MKKYYGTTIFVVLLLSISAIGQQTEIRLQFSVLDEKNEAYKELKTDDIRIVVNQKPVQPRSLKPVSELPIEALVLIDASVSQTTVLPFGKQAAEYLINHILTPGRDRVGIIKFSDNVSLFQDLTTDFAGAKSSLNAIHIDIPPGYGGGIVVGPPPPLLDKTGSTSIFESIGTTISALAKVDAKGGRKMIVVISDGVNTSGESKTDLIVEAAIKNGIKIYAVGIGDDFYDGVDEKSLKKLTEPTGGVFLKPNKTNTDLAEVMKKIENSLRFSYEVAIPDSANDSSRMTKTVVEITNPQLKSRKLKIIQQKGIFPSP